ncbi:MAG: DUF1127 domain-containing protein [Pseudomonadota bacterium]
MAHNTLITRRFFGERIVRPVLTSLARLWSTIEVWHTHLRNRQGVESLLKMDDAILRDIGVTRDDVRWASRLPFNVSAGAALAQVTGRRCNRQRD